MTDLVVATRSRHKIREIREVLAPVAGLRILGLDDVGVPESPEEAGVEAFDTFEANALAKARFFAARTPHPVLADDSGICIDALDGRPGVFSKRFSGRDDLSGLDLDRANNQHLLDALRDTPDAERSAHYVCVLALVDRDGREDLFRGTVHGRILREPRGSAGFGYDPLFFLPDLQATFAEVTAATKHDHSHRARALRAAIPRLRELGRPGPDA